MKSTAGPPRERDFDHSGMRQVDDAARLSGFLKTAGMQERQALEMVLGTLNSAKSTDSKRRFLQVFQVRQCFENLQRSGQEAVNLAVFLLERGVMRAIASGMRELVTGNWVLSLLKRELILSSESNTKIITNKALIYTQCVIALAVDSRCRAFIHKEFPDLAEVAKILFLRKLSTEKLGHEAASSYEQDAKAEILKLLMNMMVGPHSYLRKIANDTAFLKQILCYAASIREGTSEENAQQQFTSLAFIYNALVTQKVDLRTLRSGLKALVEHALAHSNSTKQVDVAIRVLFLTAESDHHETGLSKYPDLGSSLVALLSLSDTIGGVAWSMALSAASQCFKPKVKDLSSEETKSFFKESFRSDEKAMRRATQLQNLFSATKGTETSYHVERSRAKQSAEQAAEGEMSSSPATPSKPRLERRKCLQNKCGNVEAMAGSFRVCGRCRLAVYCSRDCQKRAWKEGHKDLCH